MRVYSEAYGCSLNRGEAREMVEAAVADGHTLVSSPASADLLLLDTCAVLQGTENRMLERLKALGGTGKTIVVAGCLPAVRPGRVLDACPRALMLSTRRQDTFAALLYRVGSIAGAGEGQPAGAGPPPPGKEEARAGSGWRPEVVEEVPIADGCRGICTYCLARLARGGLRSRNPGRIAARVAALVERGGREIRLAAPDSGLYGQDIGTGLCELLGRVCAIEGDFRIRVGMMNPESLGPILDGLLDAYDHPKLFKFLHIPVQSGDDEVLAGMGRRYGARDFRELAQSYRSRFPFGLLSTDIIVGFPGEGESEFERTLRLVESAGPDMVNVKAFSPRPGTTAAGMAGRAPFETVKRRIRRLNELRRHISAKNNRRLVGRTEHVLVTERARGGVLARTPGYYPVIIPERLTPGAFQSVRILRARPGFLVGKRA